MREASFEALPKCNSKKGSEQWKLHVNEHMVSHREDIDWGVGRLLKIKFRCIFKKQL